MGIEFEVHSNTRVDFDANSNTRVDFTTESGGYISPVKSVNGQVGDVVLTANDVGAEPEGTSENLISIHNSSDTAHLLLFARKQDAIKLNTTAYWNSQSSYIPAMGDIIVYTDYKIINESGQPVFVPGIKIGDGATYVPDLPFIDDELRERLMSHIISENAHSVLFAQKQNKIKSNTTSYWNSQTSYIPALDDIIVYTDYRTIMVNNVIKNIPGIKIGDGTAYVIDLPFIDEDTRKALTDHITDTDIHVTSAEKIFWNNKINCTDTVLGEELVLTRH